jgi:pimeloyl-ACP methyl ester carboxylesterase
MATAEAINWSRVGNRSQEVLDGRAGRAAFDAFVHPSFEEILGAHRVAYATYDKPGIGAPFGDPAAVRRNYAIFERYTLGHGRACALEALRWAREQFGASVSLHVLGHSEGTLVALYVYEAALDEDPVLAARIRTIVLSGLALEPIADIFARQLTELRGGDHIRAAFASCDQSVINTSRSRARPAPTWKTPPDALRGAPCSNGSPPELRPRGFTSFTARAT